MGGDLTLGLIVQLDLEWGGRGVPWRSGVSGSWVLRDFLQVWVSRDFMRSVTSVLNKIQLNSQAIYLSSGTVIMFHIQPSYQTEWSVLFFFHLPIRCRESCTGTTTYFIPRLKTISLTSQGK